ncbi:MAG: diaminopimelate epimerase [Crocinitomicaceae bacterium]
MDLKFSKYQGSGNDFVMLDNMSGDYVDLSITQIQFLCDRKLGVGADGLIKLSTDEETDFLVEYYNADGSQSFCGNGARCSVAFAKSLGLIKNKTKFNAIDGIHEATIENGIVRLEMLPVDSIQKVNNDYWLETGSPHYVRIINQTDSVDIVEFGKSIRYSESYKKNGVNVNTVKEIDASTISVETYERGVEDETLSCGTGVTACALVWMDLNSDLDKVNITTKGGYLLVEATREGNGFSSIWLSGPAKNVFDGRINV